MPCGWIGWSEHAMNWTVWNQCIRETEEAMRRANFVAGHFKTQEVTRNRASRLYRERVMP